MDRISDTVYFSTKQFNTPKISSIDATFNAAQGLIYALHNPAPEIPLVKIGNVHKEALGNLSGIFKKANPLRRLVHQTRK